MSWPYSLRTSEWQQRRARQLRCFKYCQDCELKGRQTVAAEVVAIGSALISVCPRCALKRSMMAARLFCCRPKKRK